MAHLLEEFVRFLLEVFTHWQIWLSGGGIGGFLVISVGAIEKLFDRSLSKKQYVYLFLVSFFLCACFLTWVDSDDHLKSVQQEKADQHAGDILDIQTVQNKLAEVKAQCQYQAGVADTLRRQNGDQQSTINNCQTQALKLLIPPAKKVRAFQIDDGIASGLGFETKWFVVTNVAVSPVTIKATCNRAISQLFLAPLTEGGGSVASVSTNRMAANIIKVSLQSPAFTPEAPLGVVVSHATKEIACEIKED